MLNDRWFETWFKSEIRRRARQKEKKEGIKRNSLIHKKLLAAEGSRPRVNLYSGMDFNIESLHGTWFHLKRIQRIEFGTQGRRAHRKKRLSGEEECIQGKYNALQCAERCATQRMVKRVTQCTVQYTIQCVI